MEPDQLIALKGTILLGVCLPELYDAKLATRCYGYPSAMHKQPVSDVCFMVKLLKVLQSSIHFVMKQGVITAI